MPFMQLRYLIICLFFTVSFVYSQKLAFSNNSKVGEEFKIVAETQMLYLSSDDAKKIVIPESSQFDDIKEAKELLSLVKLRNKEWKAQVTAEVTIDNFNIGGYKPYSQGEKRIGETSLYCIKAAAHDAEVIVMKKKIEFDRARPTQALSELKAAITMPAHPSYPSAHATQSYTIAHVLSYLDPKSKKKYFKDAEQISVNREIAGLHYRSDTEAGKSLAAQVFNILLKNPKFKASLDKAKGEWK